MVAFPGAAQFDLRVPNLENSYENWDVYTH